MSTDKRSSAYENALTPKRKCGYGESISIQLPTTSANRIPTQYNNSSQTNASIVSRLAGAAGNENSCQRQMSTTISIHNNNRLDYLRSIQAASSNTTRNYDRNRNNINNSNSTQLLSSNENTRTQDGESGDAINSQHNVNSNRNHQASSPPTPPPNYHEIPGVVPSYQGRSSGPPPSYDEVINPNASPPSYQSLFGQVNEARKTSNGLVDLLRQLFLILIGTLGCTMIISFLLIIPVTMIIVGFFYLNECRAENIPSFLVIGGLVWIVKNVLNCYNQFKKDSTTANRPPPRRTPISASTSSSSSTSSSIPSSTSVSSTFRSIDSTGSVSASTPLTTSSQPSSSTTSSDSYLDNGTLNQSTSSSDSYHNMNDSTSSTSIIIVSNNSKGHKNIDDNDKVDHEVVPDQGLGSHNYAPSSHNDNVGIDTSDQIIARSVLTADLNNNYIVRPNELPIISSSTVTTANGLPIIVRNNNNNHRSRHINTTSHHQNNQIRPQQQNHHLHRARRPPLIGITTFKCESMLNYFLIVWFLAGCIIVYRIYEPDYTNPLSNTYCHRTVYLYSFWLMTSVFITMAIILSCLCCLMVSSLVSCNPSR